MTTMMTRAEGAQSGRDPRTAVLPGEVAVAGGDRVGVQAAARSEARMGGGDGETEEHCRTEKEVFHVLDPFFADHPM